MQAPCAGRGRSRLDQRQLLDAHRTGGGHQVLALLGQAGDGFLDALAPRRVFGAFDFLVKRGLNGLGCGHRTGDLLAGLFCQGGIVHGHQVFQRWAADLAAIRAGVAAQPDVLNAFGVGGGIAVGVVREAGMLVLLVLAVERHLQALAGEFAA